MKNERTDFTQLTKNRKKERMKNERTDLTQVTQTRKKERKEE